MAAMVPEGSNGGLFGTAAHTEAQQPRIGLDVSGKTDFSSIAKEWQKNIPIGLSINRISWKFLHFLEGAWGLGGR